MTERPVTAPSQDLLDRQPFAESLADLILGTPPGGSLRIGVYGGWGEGKSSVLLLMLDHLERAGHVCVWLSPWAATSRESFLEDLATKIAKELGVDRGEVERVRRWSRTTAKAREAAKAEWRARIVDSFAGPAIERWLANTESKKEEGVRAKIKTALGSRKLIVFVDDLDRVRPDLVPTVLLTLQEVLDDSNFFYVLALAPDIVERGLRAVHSGWGDPGQFLEKIVEVPAHLPEPTPESIEFFTKETLAELKSVLDLDTMADLSALLPSNPRKLKLYLRYLAGLRSLAARFETAEIDWHTFYLAQLLRIEFPLESRKLTADHATLAHMQNTVAEDYVAKTYPGPNAQSPDGPKRPERVYAPSDPSRAARFVQLCDALRARGAGRAGHYGFLAMLTMPENPPVVTLKEASAVVEAALNADGSERAGYLARFVSENGRGSLSSAPARMRALWNWMLHLRERALAAAAEERLENEMMANLERAQALTSLLSTAVNDLGVFRNGTLNADSWRSLFKQLAGWAHFRTLSYHERLRGEERALLLHSARRMSAEIQLEVLDPIRLRGEADDKKRAPEFWSAVTELRSVLEETAAAWNLGRFSRQGSFGDLYFDVARKNGAHVLFDPESTFHRERRYRECLIQIAGTADRDAAVQINCLTYLRVLVAAASRSGGAHDPAACEALLHDVELVRLLWSAAVARPLNPRMAGSLREDRLHLIKMGVPEAELAVPGWWTALEEGLFGPSENPEPES